MLVLKVVTFCVLEFGFFSFCSEDERRKLS